MTLLLTACSPIASGSTVPSHSTSGLPASSSGLCATIAVLPDVAAAQRTFTNRAHEPLHALAAEPRLDRSISAHVLEAMEKVHADFGQSPELSMLTDDLEALHLSADAALRALGVEVPPCTQ